jgi:hypothetical protein
MTDPLQCDGFCEEHNGAVRLVFVQGWGKFFYCDSAIKEDQSKGLIVSDADGNDLKELLNEPTR